jgi:tRNA(fMet)-specific endonuclease VapC
MDFVLDTNILVYFVRSDEYIRQLDSQFSLFSSNNSTFISIVSVGEIRSLAHQFSWGKSKRDRMNYFLQNLDPFPIDSNEITEEYANIDAFSNGYHPTLRLTTNTSARNMGKNDLWIAATTKVFNATLLTTDNDFLHLSPVFFELEKIQFSPIP